MHSAWPAIIVLHGLDQSDRGTGINPCELHSMKICDLCKRVADRLHAGPRGAEKTEVCDACARVLMEHIAKLKHEEAATREARWAAMILDWKTERFAPDGKSPT